MLTGPRANTGESVRILFGVGGPNFTSSFHVIGEVFDKVYAAGGVTGEPQRGIQTTTVAPGGAVIVEITPIVPSNYALVDHALARMERGLAGILSVKGAPNREIYDGEVIPGMATRRRHAENVGQSLRSGDWLARRRASMIRDLRVAAMPYLILFVMILTLGLLVSCVIT